MKNRELWIYDVEVYPNFFSYCGKNIDTMEKKIFYVFSHPYNSINQSEKLYEHLSKVNGHIGYNNLNYDSQIINKLLEIQPFSAYAQDITDELYRQSEKIIFENTYPDKPKIEQLDLYKIWHFDNKAKATSLKWLEFAMRMDNIEDLPIVPGSIIKKEQIQTLIDYNWNDVEATYKFYLKSIKNIQMRQELTNEFKLDFRNDNDTKIGEKIILKEVAKELGKSMTDLRKEGGTSRDVINVNEILVDYLSFNTREFNELLYFFKHLKVYETKNAFKEIVNYKNVEIHYGLGGIHACAKKGIYTANNDYAIIDIDVASYYPNFSIKNGTYPEHLGETFCTVYDRIYKKRAEAKKNGNSVVDAGLKLGLNGAYGKSKDEYSALYDPKYTMTTTINCQLLMTMLVEQICESTNAQILQINTDGATFKVSRNKLDDLLKICKNWENKTQLVLENVYYSRMIVRDVNAYIGVYEDLNKEPKLKGWFELDRAYHKDHSMMAVRKAVVNYYVNGVDYKESIYNNDDIYDFCIGKKATGQGTFHYYNENDKLSKVIRYYVSNKGKVIVKRLPALQKKEENTNQLSIFDVGVVYEGEAKPRESALEAGGWLLTLFNKKIDGPYDINYKYYIREAEKIINQI